MSDDEVHEIIDNIDIETLIIEFEQNWYDNFGPQGRLSLEQWGQLYDRIKTNKFSNFYEGTKYRLYELEGLMLYAYKDKNEAFQSINKSASLMPEGEYFVTGTATTWYNMNNVGQIHMGPRTTTTPRGVSMKNWEILEAWSWIPIIALRFIYPPEINQGDNSFIINVSTILGFIVAIGVPSAIVALIIMLARSNYARSYIHYFLITFTIVGWVGVILGLINRLIN